MTPNEIKQRIQRAMASFWWCSESYTIINKPEISYLIDPTGDFNQVSHIDDQHPNLNSLIAEFSKAYEGTHSSVITFPEQHPRLFSLLEQHGYQASHLHDIRYCLTADHHLHTNHQFTTKIVRTKEDLIRLLKTSSLIFNTPYIEQPEENLGHMLQEYNLEKPRAIRVIALDREIDNEEFAIGSGGMSLFDELGVATLFGGGTILEYRHRGVYSALLNSRIAYAKARGIPIIGIYARHGTSAPIVANKGFLKCGEMLTWKRCSL